MVLEATKRRLTLYAVHRTGTCRKPSTPPHKAKRPKLSHSHRWASRSPQEAFESDSNLNHLRNGNANDMFYTECPTASGSQEFISGCGLCDLKNSSHDMFCHSCHAPKFAFHGSTEKSMNGQLKKSRIFRMSSLWTQNEQLMSIPYEMGTFISNHGLYILEYLCSKCRFGVPNVSPMKLGSRI